MLLGTWHNHTCFSDGKNSPEEMVQEAINLGYHFFGISDHAPVPFATHWAMKESAMYQYIKEIKRLKEKYRRHIKLFTALEVDFLPEFPHRFSEFRSEKAFDYLIGSVHIVDKFDDGSYWDIASSRHNFADGLEQIFGNDSRKFVTRYFYLLNEMISNHKPEIVAHLDLIEKHNAGKRYWNYDASWYRNLFIQTLENIAKNKLRLEINTRGLYKKRHNDTFPSQRYMPLIKKLNIKTVFSSDAHHISEINRLQII